MARLTKAQIAANVEAEIKAAQAAELKRLRAEKAAATRAANKAAATTVEDHVATAQPAASSSIQFDLDAMVRGIIGDVELPPAGRVVCGLLLGIAAAGCVGYGIGTLLTFTLAGIMTLTAAAWVTLLLTVIAWALAIYAAWKIGGYVGGKVFSSVVMPEGLAAQSYESVATAAGDAKNTVLGWFSSGKQKVVEQFSGAHRIIEVRLPATA